MRVEEEGRKKGAGGGRVWKFRQSICSEAGGAGIRNDIRKGAAKEEGRWQRASEGVRARDGWELRSAEDTE